jgi:2-polyprenyl-3-methyl-5-hydroxy-6-metoxy-1,4-benzoquinol methylase
MKMTYDFELDITTRNSNSVILKNIKTQSRVLEIGCAHGRMTKYLKEQLGCTVDIIEKNKSGHNASAYARTSLVGSRGDIEKKFTIRRLLNTNRWHSDSSIYDYIIFADVLEHLVEPDKVLIKCAKLLEVNGVIWISVPNISHNAVLIDLLQDKFEYRDFGLLDKTHLKFFTENSLEQMIDKCGLKVVNKEDLYNAVEYTEFKNSYDQVPVAVSDYLRNRPNGEVYQFVWGLEKK